MNCDDHLFVCFELICPYICWSGYTYDLWLTTQWNVEVLNVLSAHWFYSYCLFWKEFILLRFQFHDKYFKLLVIAPAFHWCTHMTHFSAEICVAGRMFNALSLEQNINGILFRMFHWIINHWEYFAVFLCHDSPKYLHSELWLTLLNHLAD